MPVGAIIGGVASVAGGLLSASAQKKAASKAADTSLAVAEKNNALQREIYGENKAILNPFVTRGNEAGAAINALLGISGTGQQSSGPQINPGYSGSLAGGNGGVTVTPNGSIMTGGESPGIQPGGAPRRFIGNLVNRLQGGGVQTNPAGPPPVPVPVNPGAPPPIAGQTPYQNAFQNYLNSTGYQFQVDQGNKGINQGYAARGSLQSGAALKALQTYGQNTATGFFKDYLGLLSNQQGVGLSGASAVAGVGQNFANSVGANNTNAGNAAANAYLAQGNANANLYGNIAGAIGGVANAFGSSYRPYG